MTEHEFHVARRMFAVHSGTIWLAPAGYPYTHAEWFASLPGMAEYSLMLKHVTRGYYYNNELRAYIGDFEIRPLDLPGILRVVELFEQMGMPVTKVGLGAVPASTQPWPSKVDYTIARLRQIADRKHEQSQST